MTTDTTREGFEKYAEAFDLPTYRATNDLYLEEITQSAWSAWQAAKSDELAFLENLVEHVDSFIWKRIDDRIAELKGESRG
ncbi:hypothetical protein [Solilutibacter silvestris]|uniref:hypothetical protein n=1 Tax=Solilutibacter silvestris TaxID=1645665 RepID=UPI003D3555D5